MRNGNSQFFCEEFEQSRVCLAVNGRRLNADFEVIAKKAIHFAPGCIWNDFDADHNAVFAGREAVHSAPVRCSNTGSGG